jgi:hypothetical protein
MTPERSMVRAASERFNRRGGEVERATIQKLRRNLTGADLVPRHVEARQSMPFAQP